MSGTVGECAQEVDVLPHRHVDQDAIIVERAYVGGVARVSLQTPHEPWTSIGDGVDFLEPRDESRHHGILERCLDASDVHLREVHVSH